MAIFSSPPTRCAVTRLQLSNFRNHAVRDLRASAEPVVLTGQNGAGKTNILEAISFLAPGRGLRRAKLSEVERRIHYPPSPCGRELEGGGGEGFAKLSEIERPIHSPSPCERESEGGGDGKEFSSTPPHPTLPRKGEGLIDPPPQGGREYAQAWAVAAEVIGPQGEVKIGTGRDPSAAADKRIVRVEGKTLRGHGELARYLSVLWLTPQMDQLFLEGGSARRRFLDRLVYSFDAEHAGRVASYEHSVRERNRLLIAAHGHSPHENLWLEAIERKIAEKAAAIAVARGETVEHINNAIQMSEGNFPKARMALTGEAESQLAEGRSALQVEQYLACLLADARPRDRISGRTGIGAHVTEITVTHLGKQMEAAQCSTGEQKALLLSLILAQARAGAIWHGVVPVLLLDEVVAHLDAQRRRELHDEITKLGAQAWLTGTDAADFGDWKSKGKWIEVGKDMDKPN